MVKFAGKWRLRNEVPSRRFVVIWNSLLLGTGKYEHRHSLSPDDQRKLTALWTRLELLLNPDEADAVSLLKLADAARQSETAAERDSNARNVVQLARNLVKTEWIRIQIELQ